MDQLRTRLLTVLGIVLAVLTVRSLRKERPPRIESDPFQ